jgi:endogenous inhibitor of DNA gyrase (YacG/DUF329 family)
MPADFNASDLYTPDSSPSTPCPYCGKTVPWTSASVFRPFCSERCKLIDLGAWASESHRIPGESLSPTDDDDSSAN